MKDFRFLFSRYILGNHNGWKAPRIYEKEVQRVINRIKGRLFVDVGAHKLFYSNRYAKNFDEVIAFEPNKNLHQIIKHPNILLSHLALSNEDTVSKFYCYGDNGADSLIKDFDYHVPSRGYAPAQNGPFQNLTDTFEVGVSTYDRQIQTVADLAKVDVEGEEFEVLDGMKEFAPRNLIVELHDQNKLNQLREKMENMGYYVSVIDATHLLGEKEVK